MYKVIWISEFIMPNKNCFIKSAEESDKLLLEISNEEIIEFDLTASIREIRPS